MLHDKHAAFGRYRELVKVCREREKLYSREPEVYHHDLYVPIYHDKDNIIF